MSDREYTQTVVLADSSQSDPPAPALDSWLVSGGVAVTTILAVAYLIQWLVKLVEACKPDD